MKRKVGACRDTHIRICDRNERSSNGDSSGKIETCNDIQCDISAYFLTALVGTAGREKRKVLSRILSKGVRGGKRRSIDSVNPKP